MRVLFITNGFPTAEHPEYCVFTKEQIDGLVKYIVKGRVIFINARQNGTIEYIRKIPTIIKSHKNYDIIHVFHGLTFILVALLLPHRKLVVSFLNTIDNEFEDSSLRSKLFIIITKLLIKRKHYVKIFKDGLPSYADKNSIYLPNGVNMDLFYPISKIKAKRQLNLDERKKYILFVSSKSKYRPQKRYDRYKEVICILKKEIPEIEELCIVGEKRDSIKYFYNSAELHLLTSDYEGSPNSIKESLACNIPVVSTNVGNVGDMLDGVNGCYVSKTMSSTELANYCMKILINSDKVNTRDHLMDKKLDIESKSQKLFNLYTDILGGN